MNQCIRLMETLVKFSFTRPVKEVQLALVGVVTILGNLRSVRKFFFQSSIFKMISNYFKIKL
jgi:hypothetical protein